MRKGLAILLGTLAFALVGANTFAKTPVISGVPDVIIGDTEDGLTIDNNWFRYVNAFNLLDYVSDEDSTPSTDLMYVFLEENSYNNLRINDKTQIDAADFDNPAAWRPNEITGYGGTRTFLLTFWDVLRSDPATQDPFPPYWPNPVDALGAEVTSDSREMLPWQTVEGSPAVLDGTERLVTMFAADEFFGTDTDTLFVMSENAGFDDLTEQVTTIFEDTFPGGASTLWTYSSVAALPQCTEGDAPGTPGYLSIQSGLTANGTLGAWSNVYFGRWSTFVQPYGEGVIAHAAGDVMYRANLTLRQDQAMTDVTPRIRWGAIQGAINQVTSNATTPMPGVADGDEATMNPQIPAQGVQQNFTTCWSAHDDSPNFDDLLWDTGTVGVVDFRGWNCFYDVFDAEDTQAGTWFCDTLLVETIPTPAAVMPVASLTDFSGWDVDDGDGSMTVTHGGGVTFNDPGATGSVRNYFLLYADTGVDWEAGKTLRINAELSCPTASDRENWHRFRIRPYTGFWHVSQEWFLQTDDGLNHGTIWADGDIGGDPVLPTIPPVGSTYTYSVYVCPNGGPTPELQALNATYHTTDITVALDQLHNAGRGDGDPGVTHTLATKTTVHSLTIEQLNIAEVY